MRNPFRRRPNPVITCDIESFDPADLASGPLMVYKTETTAPDSLADMIEDANWWTRLSDPSLFVAAATRIRRLVQERDNANDRADERNRQYEITRLEVHKARSDAKDLVKRAKHAIDEMKKFKSGSNRQEQPAALVVSPYQLAQITCNGAFSAKKLHGLPLYVAKGVYGPVVLTEDGFNALTRNAPEINLKAA